MWKKTFQCNRFHCDIREHKNSKDNVKTKFTIILLAITQDLLITYKFPRKSRSVSYKIWSVYCHPGWCQILNALGNTF